MSTLNIRIRELRIAAGKTLLEVANALGVKEATAQRYESGAIKSIDYKTILKLAEIFDCTPNYLMGWEEASPEQKNEHPTVPQGDEVSKERRELIEFCARLSEREAARMLRLMKAMLDEKDEHEV